MLVYHVGQKWRENLQPIPYIRSKHVETKVKAFVSHNNIFLILKPELQKRANRANQLVLFFLAGANFWEKHAKNRRKHAKTGEKQRFFGANFFVGKIGRC